jgi:CHASE2 domain-containing sensor protein
MTPQSIEVAKRIINTLSLVSVIVVFALLFRRKIAGKRRANLETLLTAALAAGTAPIGLALLVSAFWPDLLPALEDLHLHLAVAGLALIYLAWEEGFRRMRA